MSKEERKYLSEAIVYESFKLGSFNLIVAPCGAGKTTAAFETIPTYLNINPERSLILINTVSGEEAFVNDGRAEYFKCIGSEWDFNMEGEIIKKPIVMTYALFGAQLKKREIYLEDYDYIVCDEIHTLNKYIAMERGALREKYPQALPWEINDMLQMTCFTYIAVEAIVEMVKAGQTWVFGLTATPSQLYKHDLETLGAMVNEVQFSQKLHAYEIFQKFEYGEIEPILRALVPENRKRLFYFNTIKEMVNYKKELIECGRAAEALWSLTNNPMDKHQLTTRAYVLNEHKFPDDVQDLLINSAYETCIDIKDPMVQEIYTHTSNKDTIEQIRGRMRQNVMFMGVYNKSLKKDSRKKERYINNLTSYIEAIPEEFYGIPLYSNDKELLIANINFPKKWPTLKKILTDNGVKVTDKSDGQHRYSIISR